jgi:hypothetical protein
MGYKQIWGVFSQKKPEKGLKSQQKKMANGNGKKIDQEYFNCLTPLTDT